MKKKVILAALALLAMASATDVYAYDFSAVAPTGQTLYYNITGGANTVAVVPPMQNTWSGYTEPTDSLIIPSTVIFDGTFYAVTAIGDYALYGCFGLTYVELPSSIKTIGQYAMGYYASHNAGAFMKTVVLNEGLLSIGDNAFANTRMESIYLPSTLQTIGASAFERCEYLQTIAIPNSVVSIGAKAFNYCLSLRTVTLPATLERIEATSFYGCEKLESVTIPNTVREIGQFAFSGCSQLSTLHLGTGIEVIGAYAFHGTAITSLSLPEQLHTLGNNAFEDCQQLKTVVLNSTISTIRKEAFNRCTSLQSVSIPSNVEEIGTYAFSGCTSLQTVVFSEGLRTIGGSAFLNCTRLKSVQLPNSLLQIQGDAFRGCSALESVSFGSGLTTIGTGAFLSNIRLQSVHIPASVVSIGGNAFGNCPELSQISVAQNNPIYDSRNNCNAIVETATNTLVQGCRNSFVPSTIVIIGDYAFDGCTTLYGMELPNSVTTIKYGAFNNCTNLVQLTIGSGISAISSYSYGTPGAFDHCTGTAMTTILAAEPPAGVQNIPGTLLIPCGSRESYEAALGTSKQLIEQTNSDFSAEPANWSMGRVEMIVRPTCADSTAEVLAVPARGFGFLQWSDGSTDNPHTLHVGDTSFTLLAHFYEKATYDDTLYFYDTLRLTDTIIVDHYNTDTVYFNHYTHDTTYINNYIHDTAWLTHYVHDTAFVNYYTHDTVTLSYYDTVTINNYVHDTVTLSYFDTVTLSYYDTVTINNYVHDTVTLSYYDTVSVSNYVHDTIVLNYHYFDTAFVYNYVHDTLWLTRYVYDMADVMMSLTAYLDSVMHDDEYLDANLLEQLRAYIDESLPDTVTIVYTVTDTLTNTIYVHDTLVESLEYRELHIASANQTQGVCAGSGSFPVGTVVEIAALPMEGYRFVEWNDGNTENPRAVVLEDDAYYYASFELSTTGIATAEAPQQWTVSVESGDVVVRGEALRDVMIVDEYGRILLRQAEAADEVRCPAPTSGVYFARVGTSSARRVVVVR